MARPAAVSHWPEPSTQARSAHPPAGPTLPLRGEGLLIRPLQRPDLDSRQMWPPYGDPLHLIWDMPRCSPRENDGWFAQMNDGRHRLAYGVDDTAGRLIGMISLRDVTWGRSARLNRSISSWSLANPSLVMGNFSNAFFPPPLKRLRLRLRLRKNPPSTLTLTLTSTSALPQPQP